jgi:hypothetical protein
MPRKPAEDRAAAYFRSGGKPPPAPPHLSPKAKKLLRDITSARPPELFQPGSTELLAQYCEMCCLQEIYLADLANDVRNPELQVIVMKMAAALCQLATKLRLALTSIDKRSGILTEREPDLAAEAPSDGSNVRKFPDRSVLFGGGKTRF